MSFFTQGAFHSFGIYLVQFEYTHFSRHHYTISPIQLCLHERDFEVGKSTTSNIIDEDIMGSRKVIMEVLRHFINSAWCRFEFDVAQSWLVLKGNPIITIIIIILGDVEKRTKKMFELHKYLKRNTYLKWRDNPISSMRFWSHHRKAVISKTR
ncbi:toll-like receptor 4 [Oncorhynchus mykiss]|uniref:toll-like receptor 4 n=1 Tax=Oncorhynchus mykiss TaxID=8022 RepID=UPI001878AD94|nr:toll-like receptor 4 [Oncorhynchus mykiss]